MGLTVHFKFVAPPDTDAARARELVRALRRRALGFKRRGRVTGVLPIGDDAEALRWAAQYKSVPHPTWPDSQTGIEIPAEGGFIFPATVGEGCEPLWLGLCCYPKTVVLGDRRYRTNLPNWSFAGCTKTQYASLHGWEHFRRCHTGWWICWLADGNWASRLRSTMKANTGRTGRCRSCAPNSIK